MVREEAIDWFEEAKVDLRRAERAFEDLGYSLACFMSQQAVEKALMHTTQGFFIKDLHLFTILLFCV